MILRSVLSRLKPNKDGRLRTTIRHLRKNWMLPIAEYRRGRARFVHVLAVTGSVGKSATTRILKTIVGQPISAEAKIGINTPDGIKRTFLRMDPDTPVWVQEVSGHEEAAILASLDFLRPDVGIVTTIGMDHISEHRSLEETARVKQHLVSALPTHGVAVLNADDPQVDAMKTVAPCKLIRFGEAAGADVRLVDHHIDARGFLVMDVSEGADIVRLTTRYVGRRWRTSFLAALAGARAVGIGLKEAARIAQSVEPELYKDSVHEHDGITFVLDSFKASFWTLESSLDTVGAVPADRKIVVIGTLSDYRGTSRSTYYKAARAALAIADIVIFCGRNASRVRRITNDYPGRLFWFDRYEALRDFVDRLLQRGDVIYIKASGADHVERLWHSRQRPVSCSEDNCGRQYTCQHCKYLYAARRSARAASG